MSYLPKKIRKAFTLAEVLITIVVIGIVAAIVIPQANILYQRTILHTQFLKMYNTLTNAINISSVTNGGISIWDMNANNPDYVISNYIKPYIHIASERPIQPYTLINLKVEVIGAFNNYVSSQTGGGSTQYFLNIGSSILISEITDDGAVIMADINGVKTPNIIGRDIYFFLLSKSNNKIMPKTPTGAGNKNCGGVPDSGVIPGEGCADRMLKEGKMSY